MTCEELVDAIMQFRLLAEVSQLDPDLQLQINQLVSELEEDLLSLERRTALTRESNQPK
jgi:hypothetical protein